MYTRPFQAISKKDVLEAGGKGASLGEMTQAGIPVPDGYVVLSSAFQDFLKESGISADIESILSQVNQEKIYTIETASEQIQAIILQADIPLSIQDEIRQAFQKLDAQFVAVRSSATAEDSISAAWAGQLDTYLNTTAEILLDNIKHCYASLFSPRAIFYRFEKELHKVDISVAVVVQKMIQSEVSGVAFSVHPVTQNYNQILIEAGYGLGEAVVSGAITPDNYVIEKTSIQILDKHISKQEKELKQCVNENEWTHVSENIQQQQKLSDEYITKLSELVVKIENHYGFPCDIEWCLSENKIYIVQSRPITTLVAGERVENLGIVSQFKNLLKGRAITKQEGTFSLLLLGTGIGGCLPPYSKKYDFDFGHWLFCVDGKHGAVFFDFGKYVDTTLTAYKKFIVQKGKIKELADFKKLWKQADKLYESNSSLSLKKMNDAQLETQIKKAFEVGRGILGATVFAESIDESQIKTYYQQIDDNDSNFKTFFEYATKPIFDSFALRADKCILKKAHSFQLQYIFCDYYLAPTIEETEDKIRDLISERGGLEKISEEIDSIQNEILENKKAVDSFYASLKNGSSYLFNFVQISMYIRDVRKDPLQKTFTVISNAMREFIHRKGLNSVDAPFAFYDDFISGKYKLAEYPQEIERRKKNGISILFSNKEILFEYGGVKGKMKELFKAIDKGDSTQLQGNVAYRGNIKGVVRIVLNENDFSKFNKGEILVTSMTRPEFVPLMKKAIAVITDEGGITCHAAIVSRELKMPCIIGTKVATQVLKDGDFVEVDATNGVVHILKKQENAKFKKEIDQSELYKTQISLTEWLKDIGHKDTEELREEDNEKRERLRSLNEIIGLPFDKPTQFDAKDLVDKTPAVMDFIKQHKDESCALRLIPIVKGVEKLRMRGMTVEAVFNEWFPTQKIDPANYRAEFISNATKTHWATIFVINEKGIFGEIIRDGHFVLTQGFYNKTKPITFSYDWKSWKFEPEDTEAQEHLQVLMSKLKVSKEQEESIKKEMDADFAKGYLAGYFETVDTEFGIEYIDYSAKLGRLFGEEESKSVTGELKGQIFGKGTVSGQVKIVDDPKAAFEIGDVLVCDMTTPAYIELMKKSAAIITNQGGILSHAAIIARELGKICVVGTGNATSILKDGDKVEVDAINGVIKIYQ